MDNYATHKTPKIKAWLTRRPHYRVHFTPTSASWINRVERWFAELTRKRLSEVFIPPSDNSKPISALSSIGTTKIHGRSNGPNPLTKSSLQ
jgi:transposase